MKYDVKDRQDSFSKMHPIINFSYFSVVILCTMFFLHPVFLAISIISSSIYSYSLNGRKSLKFIILYILPLMLISIVINPLFNHEGITVLAYLQDGNPLTLESVLYGVATAFMFISVILWFSCYNAIMSSDKFIYIFGRLMPVLSLFFSMVLRFVPRYKEQIKKISDSRYALGQSPKNKSIVEKIGHSLIIISIMVTWALENSIETSDSMRARGYGLPHRTSFSIYKISKRDIKILIIMFFCTVVIIAGVIFGKNTIRYYPSIKFADLDYLSYSVYISYAIFCLLPIIINKMEEMEWKYSQSKI